MNPHDANWLDQRDKIIGMTPQELINHEQKGLRNRFLSWLLKDVDVDVLNVKHLEVYGKNTLTTPKIVLTDSGVDPANNGEITRNGDTIKIKTENDIVNVGRDILLDEEQTAQSSTGSSATTSTQIHGHNYHSYSQLATIDIDIDKEGELVYLVGVVSGSTKTVSSTLGARIKNNANSILNSATKSTSVYKLESVMVTASENNPSIGVNTYKLEGYTSYSLGKVGVSQIYGVAVKIA